MAESVPTVHSSGAGAPHVPQGVAWDSPLPEPVIASLHEDGRIGVTEFTLDRSGAASPFGDDVQLPLPVEKLRYQPPSAPGPS